MIVRPAGESPPALAPLEDKQHLPLTPSGPAFFSFDNSDNSPLDSKLDEPAQDDLHAQQDGQGAVSLGSEDGVELDGMGPDRVRFIPSRQITIASTPLRLPITFAQLLSPLQP